MKLDVKYQRSKGTNKRVTCILNFRKAAAETRRSEAILCKFLESKLGLFARCHLCEDGRLIITHTLGSRFLQNLLAEFMQNFVVCSKCFGTDTVLGRIPRKDQILVLGCKTCGETSWIEHPSSPIIRKFIIQDPRMTNENTRPDGEDPAGESTPKARKSILDETVRKLHEMIIADKNGLKTSDVLVLDLAQDILADMDASTIELVPLLWMAFIDRASHYRAAIDKHATVFKAAADLLLPYDASLLFLGCIESSLAGKEGPLLQHAINSVPRIIKSLLNHDILDGETVLGWLEGTVKPVFSDLEGNVVVSDSVKNQVRKRCEAILQWLGEELKEPAQFPHIASDLETLGLEYIKLDLVAPSKATRQRSDASEWSAVEVKSVGDDWIFLEDAL